MLQQMSFERLEDNSNSSCPLDRRLVDFDLPLPFYFSCDGSSSVTVNSAVKLAKA